MDLSFSFQDLYENKGWGISGFELNEVDLVSELVIDEWTTKQITPNPKGNCHVLFCSPIILAWCVT